MPEYTPTTENIRDCYVYADEMYDGSLATPVPVAEAEFDRWLAARDRENRAIGWDEGARDEIEARSKAFCGGIFEPDILATNPHRTEEDA